MHGEKNDRGGAESAPPPPMGLGLRALEALGVFYALLCSLSHTFKHYATRGDKKTTVDFFGGGDGRGMGAPVAPLRHCSLLLYWSAYSHLYYINYNMNVSLSHDNTRLHVFNFSTSHLIFVELHRF